MSLEPGPLLAGKIAVVTGAGQATGRGIAEAFGAHGATVVIADRDSDRLTRTADDIANQGGKVIPVQADVSRRPDVVRLAGLAGEVDILVHNLDPPPLSTPRFLDSGEEEWEALYDGNLKQVLLCCRVMIPGMIERARGGSVISVSAAADDPVGPQEVYAAFQGGVSRFSRSLAMALGPHRIRVNVIEVPAGPSVIEVPAGPSVIEVPAGPSVIRVPAGPSGEHDDLAGVALFLASDLSAFVTGTSIRAGGKALAGHPQPI